MQVPFTFRISLTPFGAQHVLQLLRATSVWTVFDGRLLLPALCLLEGRNSSQGIARHMYKQKKR